MRTHRPVLLVTLLSAVAVAMSAAPGCKDDKTPASSGGPEPTESDFISRYVKALCDRTFACCDAADRAARGLDASSADACASDLKAIFIAIGGGGEVKGTFVPEMAEACLAEVDAAPCAELEILGALLGVDETFTPSCLDAWDGSVPEGGTCGTDWDCARDRCVRNVDASGQTTSACKARAAAGEPCSATFDCDKALRCDAGTCAPRLAVGGACKGNLECLEELRCAQDSTCQAREQAGGPCAADEDCAAGTTCDGATCAPLGTAGAPCSSDSDCASSACVDATSTCADICKGS